MIELLDAPEIARRLKVSRATAYREMRGRMLHVVVGTRALRVTEAAFAAYVACRTEDPASARPLRGPLRALSTPATGRDALRSVQPRTKRSPEMNAHGA